MRDKSQTPLSTQAQTSSSRKIYVLHIIDKLSTAGCGVHGPTKTLERSIPLFDPDKFKFSICSLRAPEAAGDLLAEKGIQVSFLDRGKFDPTTITSLLSLIRKERPDILHLHGYGSTTFGRIVSLITGIPNVVHERAVMPDQPFYQTWADTLLAPFSSKAVAVSESVREFMITQRKERPDNVETIIIGIPIVEQQPVSDEVAHQKLNELGIPNNSQVVSCVGRLSSQKGQIYLLEAAAKVVSKFPDIYFLLIGDGPDLEMLKSFALENNISERVVFTGYRQDVQDLLSISKIFCLPSLWEGFPNALIEAMSLGKSVIASPAEGSRDVIYDGENGFLVPFKDSEAIAEKIIWYLQHPQDAEKMGKLAQIEASKYDIRKSVKRFSEIYTELALRDR